jgi:leader peptidase (prepilin peptidase)/N-methyltransferase
MISIFFFLFGASIGSFLLCLCHRLPIKKSMLARSYCPHCENRLPIWALIPVISYILLRAKCNFCKKQISFYYVLVEVFCGALFVLIFMKIAISWHLLYFFTSWSLLFLIALFDYKYQWFYSSFLVLFFLCRSIFLFFYPTELLTSFLGMFLGTGFLYFIAFFYQFFTKKEGLGEGDITLLGLLGYFLGPESLLAVVLYSAFLGILVGLFLLLKNKKKEPFAFAPSLILAAFCHWLFPQAYFWLNQNIFQWF